MNTVIQIFLLFFNFLFFYTIHSINKNLFSSSKIVACSYNFNFKYCTIDIHIFFLSFYNTTIFQWFILYRLRFYISVLPVELKMNVILTHLFDVVKCFTRCLFSVYLYIYFIIKIFADANITDLFFLPAFNDHSLSRNLISNWLR